MWGSLLDRCQLAIIATRFHSLDSGKGRHPHSTLSIDVPGWVRVNSLLIREIRLGREELRQSVGRGRRS